MKIVQLSNGKFVVRKGWLFREYLSKYAEYWFSSAEHVERHCLFNTVQEALVGAKKFLSDRDRIKSLFKGAKVVMSLTWGAVNDD